MQTRFKYRAVTAEGRERTGTITAVGSEQVEEYLGGQQLLPVSITAVRDARPFSVFAFSRKQDYELLIMFTNSVATMYRAGIPLLRILSIVRIGRAIGPFNQTIETIRTAVQSGKSLSEAMAEHPQYFNKVYTASIAAGEESGKLDMTLDEMALMLERELELTREIKSAVRYPLIVMSVIFAAIAVLMIFVVPRFVSFYAAFGSQLPLPTRLIIAVSHFASTYWMVMLAALGLIFYGFRRLLASPKGRLWWDRKMLTLPVLGDLVIRGNTARFCLMFRILFNAGLPVIRCLDILTATLRNTAFALEVKSLDELFRRGKELNEVEGQFRHFPQQALQMIAIGLESGNLETMLKETGDHYTKQVMYTSRHLTAIIEPILTLVLGALVLILALAIFLPMWNLIHVFSK